jgi:hypothetical protein
MANWSFPIYAFPHDVKKQMWIQVLIIDEKALIGWKTKFLINLQWKKSFKIQYFCSIGQKIAKWPLDTLPFEEYQKCSEWHHIQEG